MEDKPKNNPGSGMMEMVLLETFKETIKTNGEVIAKVVETCNAVKENTQVSNRLANALATVPERLSTIDRALRIIRWSLIPIISILVLIVLGMITKGGASG